MSCGAKRLGSGAADATLAAASLRHLSTSRGCRRMPLTMPDIDPESTLLSVDMTGLISDVDAPGACEARELPNGGLAAIRTRYWEFPCNRS